MIFLILIGFIAWPLIGILGWDLCVGSDEYWYCADWADWVMLPMCVIAGPISFVSCMIFTLLEGHSIESFFLKSYKRYRKNHPSKSEWVLRKLEE